MNERPRLDGRATAGVLLAMVGIILLLENLNLIAISHLVPGIRVGGMFILVLVSAGFWTVFALNRRYWWAIIPAGVTGTTAITTTLAGLIPWLPTGGLFLYGLAATFGLVYLWGKPKPTLIWALIPAGALAVVGTIVTLFTSLHLLVPIGLILFGIYQLRKSKRS